MTYIFFLTLDPPFLDFGKAWWGLETPSGSELNSADAQTLTPSRQQAREVCSLIVIFSQGLHAKVTIDVGQLGKEITRTRG